jgi:hypothetical protein
MVAADPIARLHGTAEKLPPKLRAEILAVGPEGIPRLVDILNDIEDGWAPVHAADLLIDLKAVEAIEPMLHLLAETDFEDVLYNRVVVRLPELGSAVLEPALTFLADKADDEDIVMSVCEVLAKLGVKDERIFEALSEVFEPGNEPLTAGLLAAYGDPRALPLIEDAILSFEPDLTSLLSRSDLIELLDAQERLGGFLASDVRERIDDWFAQWEAMQQRRTTAVGAPVRRKVGRNEPCPCGSGKKYKKCHLALDEAASPRVVEANGAALHVSGGVTDDQLSMATQFFREKDAGRSPARQMIEYAQPIIDATDGTSNTLQGALNIAMVFWNLAIIRDDAKREQALSEMVVRLDEGDRAEFEQTARMMIERHETMFPEMHGR